MASSEFFNGPGVDSANRNESQKYFQGIKAAGTYGCQPYHKHVPTVLKCGSLKLLEAFGPVKAYNEIALTASLSQNVLIAAHEKHEILHSNI
jgi:hypothetical protein